MPRKDPVTGCEVMTLPEFLNAEGEREGKSGAEVLEDIYQSLEDDNRQMEEQWRKPEVAIDMVRPLLDNAYQAWVDNKAYFTEHPTPGDPFNDPEPINPATVVCVVEVLEAKSHQSFRESSGTLTAKLELNDGRIKTVKATWWHDYGTRLDPPDGGDEVEELD